MSKRPTFREYLDKRLAPPVAGTRMLDYQLAHLDLLVAYVDEHLVPQEKSERVEQPQVQPVRPGDRRPERPRGPKAPPPGLKGFKGFKR